MAAPARTIPRVEHVQRAFGLAIRASFPLPELGPPTSGGSDPALTIRLADPAETVARFSGPLDPPVVRATVLGDGCEYVTERGQDGDYRIQYGDRATFHLSPAKGELLCSPSDLDDPAWRRFLLDSCLGAAALASGYEALHAGAVDGPDGVLAVVAMQGGGKSTLVAAFVSRGDAFFCDDVLCLSRTEAGTVVAHPGAPLMNLPPVLPDGTAAEQLGRVLATVDGERWVQVDQPRPDPRPLAAVVLLDRGDHTGVSVDQLPASATFLLPHSLLSGIRADRLEQRFELFGDIAVDTPILRLRASATAPAAEVAATMSRYLDGARGTCQQRESG